MPFGNCGRQNSEMFPRFPNLVYTPCIMPGTVNMMHMTRDKSCLMVQLTSDRRSSEWPELFILFLLFIYVWPCHTACRILVPRPGTEPVPPAVEAQSLNHWTTREVPSRVLTTGPPGKCRPSSLKAEFSLAGGRGSQRFKAQEGFDVPLLA